MLPGSGLGTLGGGGRYDKLVGMFLGRDVPAVGISFGVERIFVAMEDAGLLAGGATTTTQALVTLFSAETAPASFALAQALRAAGVRTEVYTEPKGLGPQPAFASKKGIPLAFIAGPDEVARGEVTLRDLRSREETAIPVAEAPAQALARLAEEWEPHPLAPFPTRRGGNPNSPLPPRGGGAGGGGATYRLPSQTRSYTAQSASLVTARR